MSCSYFDIFVFVCSVYCKDKCDKKYKDPNQKNICEGTFQHYGKYYGGCCNKKSNNYFDLDCNKETSLSACEKACEDAKYGAGATLTEPFKLLLGKPAESETDCCKYGCNNRFGDKSKYHISAYSFPKYHAIIVIL